MKSAIIRAITSGTTSVHALTHTSSLGKGTKVKEELMLLVAEGILVAYDDGKRVKLA